MDETTKNELMKLDFPKLFEIWKKQTPEIANAFTFNEFLRDTILSFGFLIDIFDHKEKTGEEFAQLIARCYDIKNNRIRVCCAFVLQNICTIRRVNSVKYEFTLNN